MTCQTHQFKGFAGAVQRMPKGQAIGIAIAGSFALSGILSVIFTSGGKISFISILKTHGVW